MAQQIINVGSAPNDGLGDPIREAFIKCNDNFTELYSAGGSTNAISNGNTILQINTANGNISMSVGGSTNVAVITTTGITVSNTVTTGNLISTGIVSATGNITGNYIIGNGSLLTDIVGDYSNANVADYLSIYTGDIAAGNISITGNISANDLFVGGFISTAGGVTTPANVSIGGFISATGGLACANNVLIGGFISTAGNVRGGNIRTDGLVTATGNITGGNIITLGGVSAGGNITATNIVGSGVGTFRLPNLTSLQIANLTPSNGDLIYNTTVNKIQGYENGSWGNLI